MRFGILNFAVGPYRRLSERWKRFEALGFDDAWIADDVLIRGYSDFESWALLAALARDTQRMRIGTLVTAVRFRHPAFLASQVLTLDQISQGRAAVGIGTGEPYQNETLGNPPWSPRETMERFDEQAQILVSLLRGEPIEHEGPYYATRVADTPQPVTRPNPPLVIAAHGSMGIRTAARHADVWNCLGGQPYRGGPEPGGTSGGRTLGEAVAETRRFLELVDSACEKVGRDPRSLARTVLAFLPEPDPFSSLDAFDEYVGAFAELGITAISFYWPPMDTQLDGLDPTPDEMARFERIAAERVASHRAED